MPQHKTQKQKREVLGRLGVIASRRGTHEETTEQLLVDPSDQHLPASLKQGFQQPWPVQKYEIRNGLLRNSAKSGEAKFYYPVLLKNLPSRLAKVRKNNEGDVLRFSNHYGQLGHDLLVRQTEMRSGDPLPWFWSHAETVKICLLLLQMTQDQDDEGLRQFFQSKTEIQIAVRGHVWPLKFGRVLTDHHTVARAIIRNIVSRNIYGVHRFIGVESTNGSSQDRSFFMYSALIQMIYWHLADVIDGGILRRCEADGCGAYFIQTDQRQRFCPPEPPNNESPCSSRQRMREFRKAIRKTKTERRRPHHGTESR